MPSANGHGPNRAILYARVSTDEQARSGYSLAQQIEALRANAVSQGYEILEEVQDPGQSGASLTWPGLDRVRDLVATGGVAAVLAQEWDRFAQEPAYLYLLREELEENGCKLKAHNDRGDDSPEGKLVDNVLDQFAAFERAKTAERTRRGKEAVLSRYAGLLPEDLDGLDAAQRRQVYGMLWVEAKIGPDGSLEVSGDVISVCEKEILPV